MEPLLSQFEPKLLWKHFDQIRKIPHGSKNETALANYVISIAQLNHLTYEQDEVGNVVIRKPASPGHEHAPILILQSHLDMVCEKNSDVDFNFDSDAIQLNYQDGWLTAKGTTLGADNGIGVAAALAVLEDKKLTHGPLELLFTVDEETGLTGARYIKPHFLSGRKYLNLDSEEEGVFTIGCSGGADTEFSMPITRQTVAPGSRLKLQVAGLKGGHSGLDINTGRGNAIKILNRLLWDADREFDFALVYFNGGNKRNAIPREAMAEIIVAADKVTPIKTRIEKTFQEIKAEFKKIEPDLKLNFEHLNGELPPALNPASQKVLLNFIYALPHGVLSMSQEIKDLVMTSTNLAIISTKDDSILIGQSSRSSIASCLTATRIKLKALAELANVKVTQPEGYPGWAPNLESEILNIAKVAYQACFNNAAKVAAIHAGLECGIIGEKFPGMDMVSFGPDLKNPHSPDEKVHVESVTKFWKHLVKIMEMVAQPSLMV